MAVWAKCPLFLRLFFVSFLVTYFSPRRARGCPRVIKFCTGFQVKKSIWGGGDFCFPGRTKSKLESPETKMLHMCQKIPLVSIRAWVLGQTWERGPPSAPAEFFKSFKAFLWCWHFSPPKNTMENIPLPDCYVFSAVSKKNIHIGLLWQRIAVCLITLICSLPGYMFIFLLSQDQWKDKMYKKN